MAGSDRPGRGGASRRSAGAGKSTAAGKPAAAGKSAPARKSTARRTTAAQPPAAAKKPPARKSAAAKAVAPRAGGPAACEAWLARCAESPGTTYLQGHDEALKAEILSALREAWTAAVPDAPPAVLRAGEAGPGAVLNAVQGASLFASRALVIVLRVEDWARSSTTPPAVAQGLAAIPPENLLVLVESAGDAERKNLNPLRAACARVFALDGLPPSELRRWAERHARRAALTLEPAAWDALFELPRLDTAEVFNELDKLAAWAGPDGRVGRDTVLALSHPAGGATLADLAEAIAERRAAPAMDNLLRALDSGESAGSILFQLTTLLAGALRLSGGGRGWVRDRRRSGRIAEAWSAEDIARGLDLLYRCERAWKTGRAPEDVLLVRAVQGLTAVPEAAAR